MSESVRLTTPFASLLSVASLGLRLILKSNRLNFHRYDDVGLKHLVKFLVNRLYKVIWPPSVS